MKLDDWKTVDWSMIAQNFRGFTPHFLWYLLKATVRRHVPHQYHKNLKKCLKFIRKHIMPDLRIKLASYALSDNEKLTKRKQLHRYKMDEDGILQSYYY